MIAIRTILVATDFSKASGVALAYGRNLAQALSAGLHVVHVVDDLAVSTIPLVPGAADAVHAGPRQAELNARAQEQIDQAVTTDDRRSLGAKVALLMSHTPAQAVLSYARDQAMDLIIVGTRGRPEIAQLLLGSVAQQVARRAPCPVLIVREEEHDQIART
jgi:universal stress protein A